jgi:hypothetical protein
MQKIILRSEFEALASVSGQWCVSIYLPCNPVGREGMGDALRLKQALVQAEQQLAGLGCSSAETTQLLSPLYALPDSEQWAKRGGSLVLFRSEDLLQFLPFEITMTEEVWGDQRFHVRQLLPRVVESDSFYVIALSENHAQLYNGNSTSLTPLDLEAMPRSLEDALQIDTVDRVMQSHVGAASGGGRREGAFHGHGGKPDAFKSERSEFVKRVSSVVDRHLHGQSAPLLLAMVDELAPVWRTWSNYPVTVPTVISGNCDYQSTASLHRSAWPIAEQALRRQETDRRMQLANALGSSRCICGPQAVIAAAKTGQIDTLFVDCQKPVFGDVDAETGQVEVFPGPLAGSQDLLEVAIAETVQHRGSVYSLAPASSENNTAAGLLGKQDLYASTVQALLRY